MHGLIGWSGVSMTPVRVQHSGGEDLYAVSDPRRLLLGVLAHLDML